MRRLFALLLGAIVALSVMAAPAIAGGTGPTTSDPSCTVLPSPQELVAPCSGDLPAQCYTDVYDPAFDYNMCETPDAAPANPCDFYGDGIVYNGYLKKVASLRRGPVLVLRANGGRASSMPSGADGNMNWYPGHLDETVLTVTEDGCPSYRQVQDVLWHVGLTKTGMVVGPVVRTPGVAVDSVYATFINSGNKRQALNVDMSGVKQLNLNTELPKLPKGSRWVPVGAWLHFVNPNLEGYVPPASDCLNGCG